MVHGCSTCALKSLLFLDGFLKNSNYFIQTQYQKVTNYTKMSEEVAAAL